MQHFSLATVIAFLPILVPLAGLAGAWLHALYGRKVRLKFGPEGMIEEVEVQTMKQLRATLQLADYRQAERSRQQADRRRLALRRRGRATLSGGGP